MLTFIKTQDSKPIITDKNGNSIVDLLIKDTIGSDVPPIVLDYFYVSSDNVMRADLITQKMFGYTDAAEGMMKFNGISNPFVFDEGDILYTFDVPSMNSNMRSNKNVNTDYKDIRDQYITPDKKSTVDPALTSFDKRDTARKASPAKGNQPALPPNYAAYGDTELQLRNGKIVFGSGVTKQDSGKDTPLAKSEFIARLIKNRLNNQ